MFTRYETSTTQLHQFKSTFHELIRQTKEVQIDYYPCIAENFEKNAEDFIRIIETAEGIKELNSCERHENAEMKNPVKEDDK